MKPGVLQFIRLQRVRHDLETEQQPPQKRKSQFKKHAWSLLGALTLHVTDAKSFFPSLSPHHVSLEEQQAGAPVVSVHSIQYPPETVREEAVTCKFMTCASV